MEQQNLTETDQFLTLGPTPNEPQTPKETAAAHDNNSSNNNVGGGVGVGSGSELALTVANSDALGSGVKRGRGRPRKNDAVGSVVSPATAPPGFSDQSCKRGRGRPRGSGKLQILASIGGFVAETAGGSFIPHVLTVKIGEDVVGKIMSFFDKGSRSVCILSATGTVSKVAIRQPSGSNGVRHYEGNYEILSLSGSCTYVSGPTGLVRKTGMLRISLASSTGTVFGGIVEGDLVAACSIQLVMASFKQNTSNLIKRKQFSESSNVPMIMGNPDSERDQLKVSKLAEGDKSSSSPPRTTTNGVADHVFPTISNGVEDNVIHHDHNMQHSASVNGVDLDSQEPQLESDDSDQGTTTDMNASVIDL